MYQLVIVFVLCVPQSHTMKNVLLVLCLLPAFVIAQRTTINQNNNRTRIVKTDSIKVYTLPKEGTSAIEGVIKSQTITMKDAVSNPVKYRDLLKKLNINLNPANPRVNENTLSCCNCCFESAVKTFNPNGVFTFTPGSGSGYSTVSFSIDAFADVQYLIRIKGTTNQARNFTVGFGSSVNNQGYKVPEKDFEITFIAKPQTTGKFFFTLYSNESGLWSFYNCSVTEL
jgi:hypothetical protein